MSTIDYLDVAMFPVHVIPAPGLEIVRGATTQGRTANTFVCVPDPMAGGWRKVPAVGTEYVVEATPRAGGARVRLRASCTASLGTMNEAEFLITGKL